MGGIETINLSRWFMTLLTVTILFNHQACSILRLFNPQAGVSGLPRAMATHLSLLVLREQKLPRWEVNRSIFSCGNMNFQAVVHVVHVCEVGSMPIFYFP